MLEIRNMDVYVEWLDSLNDACAWALISVQIECLAAKNTAGVKPLGQVVSELIRIDYGSCPRV